MSRKRSHGSKMSDGRTNPSFVPDGSSEKNIKQPIKDKKHDSSTYVVDLQEKKNPKDENYEPYANRQVLHPTTNSETLLHLLKGSLGTGIMAMPNAFYHAGYIFGTIGTIIIGILCTYCVHLLVKAQYELCRRKKLPSMTYPATAEAALSEGPGVFKSIAPYAPHIVNTFLLIYQLGSACVYIVFVSTNAKAIVDYYVQDDTEIRLYMVVILLPLILINWIRNLKFLAPFMTIANIITLISFGIIVYYMFRDNLTIEDKEPMGQLLHLPLFFGTVLFALEAIGVIMPLENEMKTPKSFGGTLGVLNRAMIMIVFLYVGMGLFGYLRYGDKALGSITLNLPADEILAQCVKGMLALAIFLSHGLACYVAIDITWNDYLGNLFRNSPRKLLWEYVCRTCLVLVTFLLAVAIPSLELFISLFGALCLSALGLVFPAIIQTCTFWYQVGKKEWIFMVTKNSLLAIFGLFGLVVGTYTSLSAIVKEFS